MLDLRNLLINFYLYPQLILISIQYIINMIRMLLNVVMVIPYNAMNNEFVY